MHRPPNSATVRISSLVLIVAFAALTWGMLPPAASGVPDDSQKPVDKSAPQSSEPNTDSRAEKATADSSTVKASRPVPLNKKETVLLDTAGKRLILKSKVVLREGLLEMLCCLKQTKEHESILAIDAKAYVVHTGLLALGAEQGRPVRFTPEYVPPTGQKLKILLHWTDEQKKSHTISAKKWIRTATSKFFSTPLKKLPEGVTIPEDRRLRFDARNHELTWFGPMTEAERDGFLKLSSDRDFRKGIESLYAQTQPREFSADWIFAGSGFYTDEQTGEKFYQAEGGDLICVANFPSATIDVAIESASSGENLFEAFTERIPPLDTEVTIELIPEFPSRQDGKPKDANLKPKNDLKQ